MERYNYREAMRENVLDYIRSEIDMNYWEDMRDKLERKLRNDLWMCDSVTGNASGSYFCSAWKAEEAIAHNWDILAEAMEEFGCEKNPLERGAEWCDVAIRCYLLDECIAAVLDDLEDELEELDEEAAE